MLIDHSLRHVYDSAEYDLVQDLIVPLLVDSREYYRGVGFFSSGWLRVASKGLAGLVENGGKARIVMSPIMTEGDWSAFKLGCAAKEDEVLKGTLSANIRDIAASLDKDVLNGLACQQR